MPHTTIANVWAPSIWIKGTDEVTRTRPSLITSGATRQSPIFDQAATGPGTAVNLPFFRDLTDTAEGIQVEGTQPSINNIGSAVNLAAILNREIAFGSEALAAAVSGEDPVRAIVGQLGVARQKRMQLVVLNILRGLFNFAGAPGAAAALSAVRTDVSLEAGASPAAGQLMSSATFNAAAAKMGELQDTLANGALWMHPDVRATLLNADAISFERGSRGDFILETYKGIPVFVSNLLSRAGGTNGTTYDTYLLASGVIGWGMKSQVAGVDASSLQYFADPRTNREEIYDRTRSLIHINGTRFTGTPAGQSATNAELATSTNWALAFQTADRVGVVQIRTNG